ncbi:hypothetical protein [Actinomadura chokoriensis]|uniref:Uncharacterized protein n=1 Tax=Actinomadura chokoriensis TaxID=454156 RepID=A0ABV4QU49_9ACTN
MTSYSAPATRPAHPQDSSNDLLGTFLVRTILVPALALDLGRWFWWPGRLFQDLGDSAITREAPYASVSGSPTSSAPKPR